MKLIRREIALMLILSLGILGAIAASNTPTSVVLGQTTCGITGCVSTPPLSSSTSYQYTSTSVSTISTTSTSFSTSLSSSTTTTTATTTSTFFSYTSTISTTLTTTSISTQITDTQTSTNTNWVTVSTTTSSPTTYTYVVTQKGTTAPACPVAYVTAGSILEPYANFLRTFRNNEIQNTTAGRQFMLTFNTWYYSWAPSLSYSAANNPWLFKAVELSAYPLIGILYASYYSYSLVAPFSTEAGAIAAGIVAASLLGAVFVAPAAYVTMRIFKRRLHASKLTLGPSTAWFTASTMSCLAAYATGSAQLLAIATSSMVLSMLSLGSLAGTRVLSYVQTPFVNSVSMALMFKRLAKRSF
jgi:hypothetical protein